VVQDARKAAGLDVSDRIVLGLDVEGDAGAAVEAFGDWIAAETLAVELTGGAVADATYDEPFAFDGSSGRVSLRRA
jgi:isoleucyl-tRNA synthetase